MEENLDSATQLKIETFLMNQAKVFMVDALNGEDKGKEINFSKRYKSAGAIISPKIDAEIIRQMFYSKNDFISLINNYKENINEDCLKLKDSDNTKPNDIIKTMDSDFIITCSYGRLLRILSSFNLISKDNKFLDICLSLGKDLVNEYLFLRYKKDKENNKNISYRDWTNFNNNLVENVNKSTFIFELGSKLVGWMIQLELVKSTIKTLSKTEKVNILLPGDQLEELFSKLKHESRSASVVLSLPHRLPMIVKPKLYKWNSTDSNYSQLGGYLLNDDKYIDEVFLSNWELSSKSTLLSDNTIWSMINSVNSVGFRINSEVLDFIINNNCKYNFFIDNDHIHCLSLKKKLKSSELTELDNFYSKKFLEQNVLGLSLLFKDVPTFYMPARLDYRGRLYCMVEFLNYQGTDLAKSLLEFSKGEKVNLNDKDSIAIDYLKIYGSNCYGNGLNKKSFDTRVNWVNTNMDNIINFENGILISQAENKLLFVAFCFEFRKYIQALNIGDKYFITHLPIQFDASCNGFQHLTLMIDEISLCKELNLIPQSWSDNPNDFYSFIALKVKNYFLKELNENKYLSDDISISYKKLSELNMHRNLVKKAIMTIPYNASASTILDYIKEEFIKINNPDYKDNEDGDRDYYIYKLKSEPSIVFRELDFKHLRKALNIAIFVDYPKLSNLLKYLKGIAKVSNTFKIPIPWELPSGLIVNQQYYHKEKIKVKPFTYTKNLLNLTVAIKDKYNESKQRVALMPNLVHSLDGASLSLIIENYFKVDANNNFFSVHDCFAVPCNKAQLLLNLIKSAYCILYTNHKYLLSFDANFINSIQIYYGKENVSLDIDKEKLTVLTNEGYITVKYPSLKSIINSQISQIDVSKSLYLIS